jgi:hypothetical protein
VSEATASARAPAAPAERAATTSKDRSVAARAFAAIGSMRFAVVLLLLLFVLTFLGTLEQRSASLYDVQVKYFDSLLLLHDFGPFSLPLPGAGLALSLLAVNLTVGGVVRIRKGKATIGILVSHGAILFLLATSLVEFLASDKGQMKVVTGETADEFEDKQQWEIAIRERLPSGGAREHVLDAKRLSALSEGDRATFVSESLPFDVVVHGWTRNAEPRRAERPDAGVEGVALRALDPVTDSNYVNIPGCFATLRPTAGGEPRRGVLWGYPALAPERTGPGAWVVDFGERRFEVDLRPRRWTLPFAVRLNRFVHEEHPGTRRPKEFSSYATKIDGGVERDVHVTMNAPLRHAGYTLYQSGWGPEDEPPGVPLYSVFSVVRNPMDRLPIVACAFIFVGLAIHFGMRLYRHVTSESALRAARAAGVAGGAA